MLLLLRFCPSLILGLGLSLICFQSQADTKDPAKALPQQTDNRILVLQTGSEETHFGSARLKALGPQTLSINPDLIYPGTSRYIGVEFNRIFSGLNLPETGSLILESTDGYQVEMPIELLQDDALIAYLVLSDIDAPEGSRWRPFQHGSHWISLDPFYLVWKARAAEYQAELESRYELLPWPYQLARIEYTDSDRYRNLRPSSTDKPELKTGSDIYIKHCIKCHQVSGIGGNLAPDILRDNGLADILDKTTLLRFIRHIDQFNPSSAMPVYADTITEEEAMAIIVYLDWLKAQSEQAAN